MPLGSSIIRAQGNRDHLPATLSFAYSHRREGGRDCLKAQHRKELTAFQVPPFPVLPERSFSSFTFSPSLSPNSQHCDLCSGQPSSLSYGQHGAPNAAKTQRQSGSWQQLLSIKSNLRSLFHGMIQKRQCTDRLFLSDQHTIYKQEKGFISALTNRKVPWKITANWENDSTCQRDSKWLYTSTSILAAYFMFAPFSRQPQECPATAHNSSPSTSTRQAPVLNPHALNSPWLLPLSHTVWQIQWVVAWLVMPQSGPSLGHQVPSQAVIGLPNPGYLMFRATSEQLETSPACSSAVPAMERQGGHLLQAQPAPVPWPLSSLQTPMLEQSIGKNTPT